MPELVELAEDVPEDGAVLDDILGVGELVELEAGGTRHFCGEAVHLFFEGLLCRSQFGVEVEVRGHLTLLCYELVRA